MTIDELIKELYKYPLHTRVKLQNGLFVPNEIVGVTSINNEVVIQNILPARCIVCGLTNCNANHGDDHEEDYEDEEDLDCARCGHSDCDGSCDDEEDDDDFHYYEDEDDDDWDDDDDLDEEDDEC
jgi:hypothetical protein